MSELLAHIMINKIMLFPAILKLYRFGDEFISGRKIYPEDFSYDEHERRYL